MHKSSLLVKTSLFTSILIFLHIYRTVFLLVEQQVSFDSLARYFTEGLILIWNEDYNILIPEFGLARPAFLKLIGNIV